MTSTSPAAEWPFNLDDPTRAVHFALEPNCPYDRPERCPREAEAQQTIGAYLTWLSAHTAEPARESGPVAPHGPHSHPDSPEGPATPERAAGRRTGVRCAQHPTAPVIGGICGACTIHPDDTTAPRPPMDPVHILGIGTPTTDEAALARLRALAPIFEGLARLIATSSRDWCEYRVDAWLYAVLVGWDCEETEHDNTCVHGAMEEMAARHGWDDTTVAKARRYRAAVRTVLDGPPAEHAPPTAYAEAQQRHIQVLRRRLAARQALDAAWDRIEEAAIRDLVRLAATEAAS